MRKTIGFGLLAGIAMLSPAFATVSEDESLAAASGQSVAAQVEQMGYDLQSAHERDGRYHANLLDRDTGKLVHAEFRTTDGELISARLLAKDNERQGHEGKKSNTDRDGDHRGAGDRD